MNTRQLFDTARALVAGNRGLLAMDESNPTCNKRFAGLGIPRTEEARRSDWELILTTPSLNEFIGGVILYDRPAIELWNSAEPVTQQGRRRFKLHEKGGD